MTDWRPNVGDVVSARTYMMRNIFPGRIGIVVAAGNPLHGKVEVHWRSRSEFTYTKIENLKPVKYESLSDQHKLWVVKTKMNGL